jgi:hypothetical protein
MSAPLETGIQLSSPLASRTIQPELVSLAEAQRDAVAVFYGSLTRKSLTSALVAFALLAIIGYTAASARPGAITTESRVAGAVILAACVAGVAYVLYDFRRKQRIFILEDSFAIERWFGFEVELIRWTDVARLYCLDRTTEIKHSIYFIPVATTKVHHAKLRVVLVDGRTITLNNRVREFTAMAAQFVVRTREAQLEPCTRFLVDGGMLDFEKFGLTRNGLIHKGKLLEWTDIQRISLNKSGTLLFKSPKFWWSPRFNTSALPNAALLLDLLSMFGGDVCEA